MRDTFPQEFIEMPPTRAEAEMFEVTPAMWSDAVEFYRDHRNELIAAAAQARDKAVSYREVPFKVGAAVLAIEAGQEAGDYVVYQAANFKPEPKPVSGREKRCAERNVLDAAQTHATVVAALVTVSTELSTGDATKAHDALHPCRDCRDMLRQLLAEGFVRDDTVVCNANDADKKKTCYEERKLGDLLTLYEDDLQTEPN